MTKLRSNLPLRIAGLAAGLVLAASFLASWRVEPSNGRLGADVRVLTIAPGELRATPNGVFLSARGLKPGSPPEAGTTRLRNVTPLPVDVSARAIASDPTLARIARLELRSGSRVLARGALAEASRGNRPLRIPPNAARPLEARVSIPRGAGKGWEARFADVNLELSVRYVRGER